MGTINPDLGTLFKPGEGGLLFWAPVGTDVSLDPTVPLDEDDCHYIGEISTDGVSVPDNADTPDPIKGQSGNVFYQAPSTTAPTIEVTHWELFNENAAKLHIHSSYLNVVGGEFLGWDEPESPLTPEAKMFIMNFLLTDGTPARQVWYKGTYTSRERVGGDGETPGGYTTVYTLVSDGTNGVTKIRKAA